MPAPSHEQLMRSARFVFQGTVQQEKGGVVPGMRGLDAAVVRVDQIVQGPDKLNAFEGREVTVILPKKQRIARGERAVFYTNGAYLGDTLAVEAVGHRPLPPATLGLAARARPELVLERRDLQDRIQKAEMVVVGRVASVRVPPKATARGQLTAAAVAAPGVSRRISEHDPDWREAVIEVDRVGMGAGKRKRVVVQFPASNDVRWFRAPKFTPGQQGVFILHKTPAPTRVRGRALAAVAPAAESYTALDPADVQPPELQDEIDTLVKAAQGPAAAPRTARVAKTAARVTRKAARGAKASARKAKVATRSRKTRRSR